MTKKELDKHLKDFEIMSERILKMPDQSSPASYKGEKGEREKQN